MTIDFVQFALKDKIFQKVIENDLSCMTFLYCLYGNINKNSFGPITENPEAWRLHYITKSK